MIKAWAKFAESKVLTFTECLKLAWKEAKAALLLALLPLGRVEFTFKRENPKSGSLIRKIVATTNTGIINGSTVTPNGRHNAHNNFHLKDTKRFFDCEVLEKSPIGNAWRQCKLENVLQIVSFNPF